MPSPSRKLASLGNLVSAVSAAVAGVANRLRIDAPQSLTVDQKQMGRDNLGLGTAATGSANDLITSAERTKLAAIADQATKNATDASLRDRATHTGTQPISSIENLASGLSALVEKSVLGVPGGVAQLDASGDILATQLPNTDSLIEGGTNLFFTAARAQTAVTASDVLTKLKTVDGQGSGVDTDLVRGTTPGTTGLSLLAAANAGAARTAAGLGTLATQDSSSVAVTGGALSGITASFTARPTVGGVGVALQSELAGSTYKGTWDASTNTPTITSGTGTNGDFYKVAVAGTTNINGTSSWAVGDEIRFNGTSWQKIPAFAAVASVAGRTGAVTLATSDISGLGTIATQAANNVNISGGAIAGITDIAVADGGTGASTAAAARTNLSAAQSGANSDITSLSGLTTSLSISQGGTGANSAAGARTALGLGSIATQSAAAVAITGGTVGGLSTFGVGTTTPQAPAHIYSGVYSPTDGTYYPTAIFHRAGGGAVRQITIGQFGYGGGFIQGGDMNAYPAFNAMDLYLQPMGGKLGVGTTAPAALLDVAGDAKFSGPINLPGIGGNSIIAGNGDAASYATHNLKLRVHYGLGIETYDGSVQGYYDARAGLWDVKGGYRINGVSIFESAGFNAAINAKIGVANGIAPLDSTGKVSSTFLPSYVDDVLSFTSLSAFPGTGEAGKIYVAEDTGKIYRWSGSAYVEISGSPGSTDAVPEGASNRYFTEVRVRATPLTGLSTSTNAAIAATDTLLVALGKLQAQISGGDTLDGGTF